MAADKFELKHHQVEVEYGLGHDGQSGSGIPGRQLCPEEFYRLRDHDEPYRARDTGLRGLWCGQSTTAARVRILLPAARRSAGAIGGILHGGVCEKFSRTDAIPHLIPLWRCAGLYGTPRTVIVEHAQLRGQLAEPTEGDRQ